MLFTLMLRDDNNGVNLLLLRETERLNVFFWFCSHFFFHFPLDLFFVSCFGQDGGAARSFESKAHTSFSSVSLTARLEFVCSVWLLAYINEICSSKKKKEEIKQTLRSTFQNISCIKRTRLILLWKEIVKKAEKRDAHIIYEMNKGIFIRLFFIHPSWSCSLNIMTREMWKQEKWLRSHRKIDFLSTMRKIIFIVPSFPSHAAHLVPLTKSLFHCDRLLIFTVKASVN